MIVCYALCPSLCVIFLWDVYYLIMLGSESSKTKLGMSIDVHFNFSFVFKVYLKFYGV